jgi:hypothetical protein
MKLWFKNTTILLPRGLADSYDLHAILDVGGVF